MPQVWPLEIKKNQCTWPPTTNNKTMKYMIFIHFLNVLPEMIHMYSWPLINTYLNTRSVYMQNFSVVKKFSWLNPQMQRSFWCGWIFDCAAGHCSYPHCSRINCILFIYIYICVCVSSSLTFSNMKVNLVGFVKIVMPSSECKDGDPNVVFRFWIYPFLI